MANALPAYVHQEPGAKLEARAGPDVADDAGTGPEEQGQQSGWPCNDTASSRASWQSRRSRASPQELAEFCATTRRREGQAPRWRHGWRAAAGFRGGRAARVVSIVMSNAGQRLKGQLVDWRSCAQALRPSVTSIRGRQVQSRSTNLAEDPEEVGGSLSMERVQRPQGAQNAMVQAVNQYRDEAGAGQERSVGSSGEGRLESAAHDVLLKRLKETGLSQGSIPATSDLEPAVAPIRPQAAKTLNLAIGVVRPGPDSVGVLRRITWT